MATINRLCFVTSLATSLFAAVSTTYGLIGCLLPDETLEAAIPRSRLIVVGTIQKCYAVDTGVNRLILHVDEVLKGEAGSTLTITGPSVPCGSFPCDDTRLGFTHGVQVLIFVSDATFGQADEVLGYRFAEETSLAPWRTKIHALRGQTECP